MSCLTAPCSMYSIKSEQKPTLVMRVLAVFTTSLSLATMGFPGKAAAAFLPASVASCQSQWIHKAVSDVKLGSYWPSYWLVHDLIQYLVTLPGLGGMAFFVVNNFIFPR